MKLALWVIRVAKEKGSHLDVLDLDKRKNKEDKKKEEKSFFA
jgi:hypothetical protein